MAEEQHTTYDEMPYINAAFPQTHPDRLATLAKLMGMSPPAVETCRVLELGSASGDNLVPMALAMPDARFLGIDLSARQTEQGRELVKALGLSNIELRQANIAEVDASWGKFDYIICHGIYSWVPAPIRDKILSISRDNLAHNGVAYVSYNTYPGWRMRGMIRDMMVYHANRFEGAANKVQQARGLLDFLAQSTPTDSPFGLTLRSELDAIRNQPDAYLFHDHLEVVNEPVYFHEFAELAQQHGLQYLAEADFGAMLVSNFAPQIADTLRKIAPDIVRMEQYMDFVRNRMFRQTLLVHADLVINRSLTGAALKGLYVAAFAVPASRVPSLLQGVPEQFRAPSGGNINTVNAITKAALMVLRERYPQALRIEDLAKRARERVDTEMAKPAPEATTAKDVETLGTDLLTCYTAALIELRSTAPRLAIEPSERPVASPFVRIRATTSANPIVNLRHEPMQLDMFNRHLVTLLDGTRDRDAIVAALADLVAKGTLVVRDKDVPVSGGPNLERILGQALDENLPKLGKAGLLLS